MEAIKQARVSMHVSSRTILQGENKILSAVGHNRPSYYQQRPCWKPTDLSAKIPFTHPVNLMDELSQEIPDLWEVKKSVKM